MINSNICKRDKEERRNRKFGVMKKNQNLKVYLNPNVSIIIVIVNYSVNILSYNKLNCK